jgi:serine-type D-Ala-D-Ala carboxypeptidase (penicillin-binding protein 5/6)
MTRTSALPRLLPSLLPTAILAASLGAASTAAQAKPKPQAAAARKARPYRAGDDDRRQRPIHPADREQGRVLMDFYTGQLFVSSNPEEPLPPASLTKMMTTSWSRA